MKNNKILILTLGTGDNRELINTMNGQEIIEETKFHELISDDAKIGYRTTVYRMQLPDITQKVIDVKTEYVAEPLIKSEIWDKILIIGTVKSQWFLFFLKYFDKDLMYTDMKNLLQCANTLYHIQKRDKGLDIKGEELQKYQETIQLCFERGKVGQSMTNGHQIKILLTEYGLDQQELDRNYELITQKVRGLLEKEAVNEIAFDITHSFRSMPIYNLAVFQYFRDVTEYDIRIKHVYYGCLDVARETVDYTPIVELGKIVDLMKLSGGINEFKNTGSSNTLIAEIESWDEKEKYREFVECLQRFELAVQLNAYDHILNHLETLLSYTKNVSNISSSMGDLYHMFGQVLKTQFHDDIMQGDFYVAERQFQLTEWYCKQQRIGLAAATAMETLRSYLTPIYLKWKECDSKKLSTDENKRKEAIQLFSKIEGKVGRDKAEKDMIEELRVMENDRKSVVEIRNRFAHNLVSKENVDGDILSKDTETINKFVMELGKLRNHIRNHYEVFYRVYTSKQAIQRKSFSKPVKLFLMENPPSKHIINMHRISKHSKKQYELYYLPKELYQIVEKAKAQDIHKKCIDVSEYIKSYFEIENVILCIQGLNMNRMLHTVVSLQLEGIEKICVMDEEGKVEDVGKFRYELAQMEATSSGNSEDLLSKEPQKL